MTNDQGKINNLVTSLGVAQEDIDNYNYDADPIVTEVAAGEYSSYDEIDTSDLPPNLDDLVTN